MSYENVKNYFSKVGLADRLSVLEQSSATVEEAAQAIGCEPHQIAKTLSFLVDDQPVLIVAAGHARIDNRKYKTVFGQKARMIPPERLEELTGHSMGGVCPFATKPGVRVHLDVSLQVNQIVYPAAGANQCVVRLDLAELEQHSNSKGWVDVTRTA